MPKLKNTPFFIKLSHWEYWPFELIYFPVFFYWVYLSIKNKSPFFFSATNPSIEAAGLLEHSKFEILNQLQNTFKPKTILVDSKMPFESILLALEYQNVDFPIIAKPNIGKRGFLVEKILDQNQLIDYLRRNNKIDLLIQEFISLPEEYSIMYYRYPNEASGKINSITHKEYLNVIGDGKSNLLQLIKAYPRARLQLKNLKKKFESSLYFIPEKNEKIQLGEIGNHSKGTKFLDANHLIDQELVKTFDKITENLDGFYLGRFDLKCRNFEDLKAGKSLKILEVNGIGAEVAHIYDPNFAFWKAQKAIFQHWTLISKISNANRALGEKVIRLPEAWAIWTKSLRLNKLARS